MNLLIDIGNHRLKWATADGGGDLGGGGALTHAGDDSLINPALADAFAGMQKPAAVWVSSVAAAAVSAAVTGFVRAAWSLTPRVIVAQKKHAGVTNGYADPAALGADRWAALVAAAALRPARAVVVVDAGSAVTVDLLDAGGVHRGGVIFPGVYLMRAALAATANLGDGGDGGGKRDDGDTDAAVADGITLAVAGGVTLAVARRRASLPPPARDDCGVILTGGDAERIRPLLADDIAIVVEPQLVLRGLAVLAAADGNDADAIKK